MIICEDDYLQDHIRRNVVDLTKLHQFRNFTTSSGFINSYCTSSVIAALCHIHTILIRLMDFNGKHTTTETISTDLAHSFFCFFLHFNHMDELKKWQQSYFII